MTMAGRMAPRLLVAFLATSILFEAGATAPALVSAAPQQLANEPAEASPRSLKQWCTAVDSDV